MTNPNTNEKIKNAVDSLLDKFVTGEMPKHVAWSILKRNASGQPIPSDSWSLGNRILMVIQGTNDARGFRQWEAVGRHVKKGSKAVFILAPITRKIKDTDPKTGEEVEKVIITSFKPINVFRYEDTEGEPLEYLNNIDIPAPPPFWGVAAELGIKISYSPMSGNALGSFSPSRNEIKLHASDAIVYLHELSHAVHNTFADLRLMDTAKAEIVAEFAGDCLCELANVPGYEQQGYDYIKSYAKADTPEQTIKRIMGVMTDVEKILTTVLDISYKLEAEKDTDNEEAPEAGKKSA